MKCLARIAAFSLLVIALFAGFANFGVPRIEPAPPPLEEKLDLGAMTLPQFLALGERIYNGKGTCTLCHNPIGGRAPLLDKVAVTAQQRLADARYKGKAKDAESYLLESMVTPSAYVVAGFGKKGTNDAESPMPDVSSGGIRLTGVEIGAVVAYLQNRSGVEVTVKVPDAAQPSPDAGKSGEQRKALATVEEILEEALCGGCHKIAGAEGAVGPDLTRIGARRDAAQIRRSILDPNAEIAEGFQRDLMPSDYGERLYAKELEMLVEYLATLK